VRRFFVRAPRLFLPLSLFSPLPRLAVILPPPENSFPSSPLERPGRDAPTFRSLLRSFSGDACLTFLPATWPPFLCLPRPEYVFSRVERPLPSATRLTAQWSGPLCRPFFPRFFLCSCRISILPLFLPSYLLFFESRRRVPFPEVQLTVWRPTALQANSPRQ